jgi:2-keto-4-pentenoate hydratase/2-oxohepta-3-ene-1,7-dioic acid hydratase in catechol pathway
MPSKPRIYISYSRSWTRHRFNITGCASQASKKQRLPWERAKAFDNSSVLSSFIKPATRFDFANIELQLIVNDKTRQQGNSRMMLTPIPQLLEQIAKVFTLMPVDVVLTGTPSGVGR